MSAPESDYAQGLARGAVAALEQLTEQVAEQIRHTEDPSSEGPTWLGLQQMFDQALAAARDFGQTP